MELIELKKDLFSVDEKYKFVQCVSADFGMGRGIATQFNQHFNTKERSFELYPNYLAKWKDTHITGDCLEVDRVFNLITKTYYFEKPTYSSLNDALLILRRLCEEKGIQYLAMPQIGCGLDKLQWPKVKQMLISIFEDLNISILICIWDKTCIEADCNKLEGEW